MTPTDPLQEELRQRLIHVELKLDRLLGGTAERASPDQRFGPQTYAQGGEDLVLLNIFARLGIARPTWLDIGAHHPWRISNTALLYARGWRSRCIPGAFIEHYDQSSAQNRRASLSCLYASLCYNLHFRRNLLRAVRHAAPHATHFGALPHLLRLARERWNP